MNDGCRKEIFTIGHSTRRLEDFIELLEANTIELVADVRTVPRSRSNPQFNQESFPQSLGESSIGYVYFPELGGWRRSKLENSPNTGWRTPAFKNYADYMLSEKFTAAIQHLISTSTDLRTVVMCAEAVPWRCHRTLISDALTVRGLRVMHIISKANVYEHSLTPWAEVAGETITYPA